MERMAELVSGMRVVLQAVGEVSTEGRTLQGPLIMGKEG